MIGLGIPDRLRVLLKGIEGASVGGAVGFGADDNLEAAGIGLVGFKGPLFDVIAGVRGIGGGFTLKGLAVINGVFEEDGIGFTLMGVVALDGTNGFNGVFDIAGLGLTLIGVVTFESNGFKGVLDVVGFSLDGVFVAVLTGFNGCLCGVAAKTGFGFVIVGVANIDVLLFGCALGVA